MMFFALVVLLIAAVQAATECPSGTRDSSAYTTAATVTSVTCSGGCLCQPSTGTFSGTISDGTSDYVNNLNCNWLIASSGVISLSFSSFNTESNYDFVTINSFTLGGTGWEDVEQVAKLSGSSVSPSAVFTSSTGYMQLVFTSDSSAGYPGFVASWTTTKRWTVIQLNKDVMEGLKYIYI